MISINQSLLINHSSNQKCVKDFANWTNPNELQCKKDICQLLFLNTGSMQRVYSFLGPLTYLYLPKSQTACYAQDRHTRITYLPILTISFRTQDLSIWPLLTLPWLVRTWPGNFNAVSATYLEVHFKNNIQHFQVKLLINIEKMLDFYDYHSNRRRFLTHQAVITCFSTSY